VASTEQNVSLRNALRAAYANLVPNESESSQPVYGRDDVRVEHPQGNVRATFGPHGWLVSVEDAGGEVLNDTATQTTDQAVGAFLAGVSLLDFRAEWL
jgi:hypothetical protein